MKHILIILAALLFFTSCSKNLEEKPQSIAAETFYNTQAEIESGLNTIYQPVRGLECMGAFYPIQLEIYAEYMYGRGSHAPLNTYEGLNSTNITRIANMWTSFYRAIRNANVAIQRIPLATQVNEDSKKRYLAEAKFMRALWYFQLVRNWAGVPLRTENNMDSINVKRSSVQEVYDLIVSDLVTAKDDLPETPRLTGTPSKWSAKTVLTEVYLNLGKYTEARDEALSVIQSNKYALVNVAVPDDFEKIFGADANNTTEEIFYIKFSNKVAGQGFEYVTYEHYPNSGYYPLGGFYTLYSDSVNNLFVKNWDANDLRRTFNWYPRAFGLAPTTLIGKKYNDRTATVGAGNDLPMYRYADLLLFYAEADARVNNGPTTDAVEKLNMVHRRAYGKSPTVADPITDIKITDYPTTNDFIMRVVKERAYENIQEGKHWLDMKRLGIAKQTILAMKGITVAEKHMLWPIPSNEYNYNKAIDPTRDQNPGY